MVSRNDGRGQIVLIGAITIAVLIVGLVVVSNSALYTENIDEGGAAESGREASEFGAEVQQNTRSLVIRVNHDRRYASEPQLRAAMRDNISTYSAALGETYVDSRSTRVNLSVDLDASTYGQRVLQDEDAQFVNPANGSDSWTVVGFGPRSDVGWLVFNLNVSELSVGTGFDVRLVNASGEFYEVTFRKNVSGAVDIQSNFSAAPASNETTTCRATRGRLLVDALGGSVFGRDCSFNATENLAPPYTVRFDDGDAAAGTYELVVEDQAALHPTIIANTCAVGATTTDECRMPAVWTASVTASYRSTRVDYEQTWNLEVYNSTHGP